MMQKREAEIKQGLKQLGWLSPEESRELKGKIEQLEEEKKKLNNLWHQSLNNCERIIDEQEDKVDQLEKDKAELIDTMVEEYKQHHYESWYIHNRIKNAIEKYTGKSIEELLK